MAEPLPIQQLIDPEADRVRLGRWLAKSLAPLPRPRLTMALLISSDILALLVAGGLSIQIRYLFGQRLDLSFYAELWPAIGLFILAYAVKGLYSGVTLNPASELRLITISTNLVYLTLGVVIFLLKVSDDYSRSLFLIAWSLSLLLVPFLRSLTRSGLARTSWWGHPVVILGSGAAGQRLIQILKQQPTLGLKPVAVLSDPDDPQPTQDHVEGVPCLGSTKLASELAQHFKISYAIVAIPHSFGQLWQTMIEHHGQYFHHLIFIPDLIGFSSLWVEAKDIGGILGLEVRQQLLNPRSRWLKRLIDLIGSSVGLVLLAPVLVILAVLIKLDSPGSLLFAQERLGRSGQRFKAYKFRSMYVNAEERLQEILQQDPEARREYEIFHKLSHDPRVTRVGRVLRKFSLDELPQLWNVVVGDMSLVGPRAYIPRELPEMHGSEQIILQVLPGITGLWQVSGRNKLSFPQRLALDIYYVRNWSPWLDFHILARTIWVVISGYGAQ